jgi:hypothetical protein
MQVVEQQLQEEQRTSAALQHKVHQLLDMLASATRELESRHGLSQPSTPKITSSHRPTATTRVPHSNSNSHAPVSQTHARPKANSGHNSHSAHSERHHGSAFATGSVKHTSMHRASQGSINHSSAVSVTSAVSSGDRGGTSSNAPSVLGDKPSYRSTKTTYRT